MRGFFLCLDLNFFTFITSAQKINLTLDLIELYRVTDIFFDREIYFVTCFRKRVNTD